MPKSKDPYVLLLKEAFAFTDSFGTFSPYVYNDKRVNSRHLSVTEHCGVPGDGQGQWRADMEHRVYKMLEERNLRCRYAKFKESHSPNGPYYRFVLSY